MNNLAPQEKGPQMRSVETAKLTVSQPKKLEALLGDLDTIEGLAARVSERTGEDRSSDMGGASAGTSSGGQQGQSARDEAIAAMPAKAAVLQKKLSDHITAEVRHLEHLAKRASRSSNPGSAFQLNQLYARIRRLNTLLVEVLHATMDVLRRLYIRVFIDQQPVL